MVKIVNEIPGEFEDETTEVEITSKEDKQDYEEAAQAKQEESKKAKAEPEFEIEEEDDTPPQDRNRDPLPKDIVDELENDNLEDYSAKVKARLAQMKKVWHDERRAKEAADRERQEAVAIAQRIINENRQLKQTLSYGEEDYLKTLKEKYETDLTVAKRDYKEAYDLGDTDKIIEAQTRLNDVQFKLSSAAGFKPQYKIDNTLQTQQNSGQLAQNNIQVQKPDSRALEWQSKNTWFGQDEEMTSLALGLHEKLVRSGVSPANEDYYRRIDETMQKRFPEYFGESDDSLEDKPAQRKLSTVVAPATRSTAPKKVRLTKTQLALAKKFKLTPEQYARELIKTENANG
jgi:hypothetical protein